VFVPPWDWLPVVNEKALFDRPSVKVNAARILNFCMLIVVLAGFDTVYRYCSVKDTLGSKTDEIGENVAFAVALSTKRYPALKLSTVVAAGIVGGDNVNISGLSPLTSITLRLDVTLDALLT